MGTPYKMKGSPMARNYGAPFKEKPTKKELRDAANDKNNPNHISNQESEEAYYAWRGGSTLAPNTYHGAGGTIVNEDGTTNKVLTKDNVAGL